MKLVTRIDDDASLPLVGEIIGYDGEDAWVLWGEEDRRASIMLGSGAAVREAMDELRPFRR